MSAVVNEGAAPGTLDHIIIDQRFCGPPNSGNGGYVCGRLAHYVGDQATVRLMRPPPLDTSLEVRRSGDAVELREGDTVIARAWPETRVVQPPPAPDLQAARQLRGAYAGLHGHAFPTCFVCGTERGEGDGLRIFPGNDKRSDPRHYVACDWTPYPGLCDENGLVRRHFVWAVLDCPSGWAFLSFEDSVGVLGEFSVQVHSSPRCGENYIVAGWGVASDGRKRFTASALHTAEGEVVASARATWIVIDSSRSSTRD